MRFLICGLGSIGRRHLRNLQALGQDDIVLYRTGKSTMDDDELAGYPIEPDLETALARWEPDAVLVTNPTALHLETAQPAAEAGAHVFLEKPVSHAMEGVNALRQAVQEQGIQVCVGYQFRFHPGLQRAKELLEEGAIGEPLSAAAHWGEYLPSWHPWEDYRESYSARADLGGGVLLTLSHPLDYLRWMLGEVESVTAEIGSSSALDTEVEDSADLILRHQEGVLTSVHLDYHQRPMRHDMEIVGSEGTLLWSAVRDQIQWWTAGDEGWQVEAASEDFERNSMFLDEMRQFIAVISGEADPVCGLDDGVAALRIALAALNSAEAGRRVELREKV